MLQCWSRSCQSCDRFSEESNERRECEFGCEFNVQSGQEGQGWTMLNWRNAVQDWNGGKFSQLLLFRKLRWLTCWEAQPCTSHDRHWLLSFENNNNNMKYKLHSGNMLQSNSHLYRSNVELKKDTTSEMYNSTTDLLSKTMERSLQPSSSLVFLSWCWDGRFGCTI